MTPEVLAAPEAVELFPRYRHELVGVVDGLVGKESGFVLKVLPPVTVDCAVGIDDHLPNCDPPPAVFDGLEEPLSTSVIRVDSPPVLTRSIRLLKALEVRTANVLHAPEDTT